MNTENEYNDEPVYYCRNCLSLRILRVDGSKECYCDKCTSTHIGSTDIFTYLKKLEQVNSIYNRKHSIGDLKNGCKKNER